MGKRSRRPSPLGWRGPMRIEVPPHRNNAAGAPERMEVQLPQKLQRVSSTDPQFVEGG